MELVSIEARTALVASTEKSEFRDGTAAYDAASMAMIRLAALLERQEMTETAGAALSPDELAATSTFLPGRPDRMDDYFGLREELVRSARRSCGRRVRP